MSERHVVTEFEGSQFRDLVEAFACPNGDCGQPIRFTRMEPDGETECPRCGANLLLEVVINGDRDPTE